LLKVPRGNEGNVTENYEGLRQPSFHYAPNVRIRPGQKPGSGSLQFGVLELFDTRRKTGYLVK